MSDFDVVHNRRNTNSGKWDRYAGSDILPMWVADMDFRSPQAILEAIKKQTDQGIFGYHTQLPAELVEVVVQRLQNLYGWKVEAESILFSPGVVPALNQTCRSLVGSGESIVTVTPVYFPFLDAPNNWDRKLYRVPAQCTGDNWSFPVEALIREIVDHPDIKLLLLCSPHNPIGKTLARDELEAIVEVCRRHQVAISSDEIHCDLLLDGRSHIPTASVSREAEQISITMMSATKTFNLAGLGGAFVVIANPQLREQYLKAGKGIMPNVTTFAFTSMLTAFQECAAWHQDLLTYLQDNRDYLADRIEKIAGLSVNHVEATYLAWLNVKQLKLSDPMSFFESAGVGLSDGAQFDGPGYMRLNFACSSTTLTEACDRLERAVSASGNG